MKCYKLRKKILFYILIGLMLWGGSKGQGIVMAAEKQINMLQEENRATDRALVQNLRLYSDAGTLEVVKSAGEEVFPQGITETTTSMPSTGDVNTLILTVEFQDASFEENIKQVLENNFFADGDEANDNYPRESAKAFYERSSFGKFKLDGDIIQYTSPNERSFYDDDMNVLIEEIIEALPDLVEAQMGEQDVNAYLEQFDSNGDKILDGVYICYAGGTEVWGEQWWSYVGYWDGYTIGNYSFGSTCILGDYEPYVIIHETGHMLGLGDYYDYNLQGEAMAGIASLDMMRLNLGDHNAFSKMLLGWIEPDNVTIISGDIETVQLSECSEEGECIIVLPDYNAEEGLYTEFYLFTYREYVGNNYIAGYDMPQGGICVYYVNATLNEQGDGFQYDVSTAVGKGTVPLIRQIHQDGEVTHGEVSGTAIDGAAFPWPWMQDYEADTCCYHPGDVFTPYTLPSSSFFVGADVREGRTYSGITMKNIAISDGSATFDVGIETEQEPYEVSWRMDSPSGTYSAITGLKAEVLLSTDITMKNGTNSWRYFDMENGAQMVDEDGNIIGYLTIRLSKLQDGVFFLNGNDAVKAQMEEGRLYRILIPEGTFYDAFGQAVREISLEYSTVTEYPVITDWEFDDLYGTTYKRCIDEAGNGIFVRSSYQKNDDYVLDIYRIENFRAGEQIFSDVLSEFVLTNENMYSYPSALWKVDESSWGWVSLPQNNKICYLVFNELGNIVAEEEIPFEKDVLAVGESDADKAYFVTADSVVVFRGTDWEEHALSYSEAEEENQIEGIYCSYITKNNICAINTIKNTFLFDADFNLVYETDCFTNLAGLKYMDGRYYLAGYIYDSEENNYDNYVEVLDESYRLIESYDLDIDGSIRSFGCFSNGFAILSGYGDLYLLDETFKQRVFLEDFPAAAIYQESETCLRLYGASSGTVRGISLDVSSIDMTVENPFGDVTETDWYYKYAKFALDNRLMNGKGTTEDGKVNFDPANTITRGEFVRIIYNKEGAPEVAYSDIFVDVPEGMWYTKAIVWAYNQGLVSGKEAAYFDVDGNITRQEIAQILYKYALYKEYDVSCVTDVDLATFVDEKKVADWGRTAIEWAVGYGVVKGKDTEEGRGLSPDGNAIRAEAATMMKNFMVACEGIEAQE